MNLDYFNYGQTSQGLATQDDYQSQQFNSKGDNLSPTPTGAPIAVDYNNDNRTSQDFKAQAAQAQRDTISVQNNENKIIGQSGYAYDKITDTRADKMRNAAMAFAEGYFGSQGDAAQAGAAGGMAAMNATAIHEGMLKRQGMIHDLESKGYNPIDIDQWIKTGNTKDLITNKGSWTSDGKGYLHNTLTGEVKQVPGYQAPAEKLTHIDLGDSIGFVNQAGQVVNKVAKGSKPGATASDSGIGLDDDEASSNDQMPEVQNGIYGTRDSKGTFKPLGQKEQNYWREHAQAKQGVTPAGYKIENNNLDTLANATPEQLDSISGRADQFLALDNPVISLQTSDKNRPILQAAQQVTALQGLSGAALAKAAGLSGLNTEAEFDRVAKAVSQLDRSSPQALLDSVKKIKKDLQLIQDEHNQSVGVSNNKSTPDNKTESGKKDFSSHW